MCIFHRWLKWSAIKEERWAKIIQLYGYSIGEPSEYARQYQDRYCDKCGKYQKRYLN